jgi:hypothetical protein
MRPLTPMTVSGKVKMIILADFDQAIIHTKP